MATAPGRVRLSVSDLWVGDRDDPRPLGELGDHWPLCLVRGRLVFEIGGRALPRLGSLGPDDACLNHWVEALAGLERALSGGDAEYVADQGERDQPAFAFRLHGTQVSVSVEDSRVGDGRAEPLWSEARCDVAELLDEVSRFLRSLQPRIEALGPVGERWWEDHTAQPRDWVGLDDDAFFAGRRHWMFGPCFEVHLWGRGATPPSVESLNTALGRLPDAERAAPVGGLEHYGPRWILGSPSWSARTGFHVWSHDERLGLSTFPHQLARVCGLPEDGWLWPAPSPPTPEAGDFLVGLTDLVARLATDLAIDRALLVSEAVEWPRCALESGWIYGYAWGALADGRTADPRFGRASLRPA